MKEAIQGAISDSEFNLTIWTARTFGLILKGVYYTCDLPSFIFNQSRIAVKCFDRGVTEVSQCQVGTPAR